MLLKSQLVVAILAFPLMLALVEVTETVSYDFVTTVREITRPWPKLIENDDMVPTVDYGIRDGLWIGEQFNPVPVSLRLAATVRDKDAADREITIRALADSLVDAIEPQGDYGLIIYQFPWPDYDLEPPFVSALAQGFSARALAQAYTVTGDERHKRAGELALRSLFVPIEKGGATIKTDRGWWYEEYAKKGVKESRVLNGMMYVMLAVHTYWEITRNEDAKTLFDNGLGELVATLPEYDNGGFSYYDNQGKSAGGYHKHHIDLLDRLFKITGEPLFAKYRDRWAAHWERPFAVRLFMSPTKKGIAIALLNTGAIGLFLNAILLTVWLRGRSKQLSLQDEPDKVQHV